MQNVSLMFHLKNKNVSPETFSSKTMTVKFYLKPVKSSGSGFKVYAQIIFNRTKAEFTTGLPCEKSDWNPKKQEFNKNSLFNQRLSDLKMKIYRIKNNFDELKINYSAKDLKIQLLGSKKSEDLLLEYFQEYIDRKLKDGSWSQATSKLYFASQNYLTKFLSEHNRQKITLENYNLTIIAKFDDYLRQIIWNDKGDRLSITSINKHHTRVKTILGDAISRGKLNINPYAHFKLTFPQGNREYLTKEELDKLNSLDLSKNESLDQVRDIFMFSCYTGLRFCDAIDLKMEDIQIINDEPHIRVDQIKTGERREIPLIKPAISIVDKYNWSKFRSLKGNVLPIYTNQRVNRYLKFISNLCGIKKNLTHHIARHTCATTILLDNNVPIEVVSHWLGHTNIKTTQIYAKISHTKLQNESKRLNDII